MNPFFDEALWTAVIRRPDWHVLLASECRNLFQRAEEKPEEAAPIKEALYGFFERALADGSVALAAEGEDWDRERQRIDTVVIHHTSQPAGITPERLSAMHLVRLYAPSYLRPSYRGYGIFSGHFRGGRQVFYAYHWLVRQDGSSERLLEDREIGWHAGNWQVNCQSVAICLDGDFTDATPNNAMIMGTAALIRQHYPDVPSKRLLGHREVNERTTCPGERFQSGWKGLLLRAR